MSEHAADRALPPAQHEPKDVGLRFMLALFALIGVTLLLSLGLVAFVFPSALKDQRFAQPFPNYPNPELRSNPPGDMRTFYAAEMARLNGADWQDRQAGTVHIPIDQAMRIIAAEGIPGWPAPPASGTAHFASDGVRH